jgi:hypothetical protein
MTHVVGSPVWTARRRIQAVGSFGLFALCAILGGAATGAVLGGISDGFDSAWIAFAAISLGLLARDWFELRIPLPQVRLQVPEGLKGRRPAGPIVYGLILGAGVLTFLPSAVVYIYVVALLLLATPVSGALAGALFGASYALAVLILGSRTRRLNPVAQAGNVKRLFALSRKPALVTAGTFVSLMVISASPLWA